MDRIFGQLRMRYEGALGNSWWPHLLAAIAFLALFLVSWLLWIEISRRFPLLPPGSYLGSIHNVFDDEPKSGTKFYVERSHEDAGLFFVVFREGWSPKFLDGGKKREGASDPDWIYPVTISAADTELRFVGNDLSEEEFVGVVTNIGSDKRGNWKLRRLRGKSEKMSDDARYTLKNWLQLRSELDQVESQIGLYEEQLPKVREKVEKITRLLTDEQPLHTEDKEKLISAQTDLEQAEKALRLKQEEVKKLEKKVALAQRVTKMGKLVELSREAGQRENRWFDSMRKTSPQVSREVQTLVDRGESILRVKREIEVEETKISYLRDFQRGRR